MDAPNALAATVRAENETMHAPVGCPRACPCLGFAIARRGRCGPRGDRRTDRTRCAAPARSGYRGYHHAGEAPARRPLRDSDEDPSDRGRCQRRYGRSSRRSCRTLHDSSRASGGRVDGRRRRRHSSPRRVFGALRAPRIHAAARGDRCRVRRIGRAPPSRQVAWIHQAGLGGRLLGRRQSR